MIKFALSRKIVRALLVASLYAMAFSSLALAQGAVVSCSSDDMRYHTCPIGPNHDTRDVRVVRQRSDAQCIQGYSYGVRGDQLWVDRGCRADFEIMPSRGWNNGGNATGTITCSSDDMRRHFCNIAPGSRARLSRQRSDAQCIEGQTWGQNGNQLWVDRGCRADFVIEARRDRDHDWHHDRDHDGDHDGDHDRDRDYGQASSSRVVTCSSDDMHRHTCNVGANRGIRLVRQRSDARCELNRSYGFSGNQIWVDRGCRADFEVMAR